MGQMGQMGQMGNGAQKDNDRPGRVEATAGDERRIVFAVAHCKLLGWKLGQQIGGGVVPALVEQSPALNIDQSKYRFPGVD